MVNVSPPPPPLSVIWIVRVAVTVSGTSLESVICTENVEEPTVVGVPEITPVVGFKVSPAGSVPLARLHCFKGVVPPVTVSVAEYGVATVPEGVLPEITGAGLTVMLTTFEFDVPPICAVSVTWIGAVKAAGAA